MIFGSIGHDALEAWYAPDSYHSDAAAYKAMAESWEAFKAKDFFREENLAAWGILASDVTQCLTNYFDNYRNEQMTPICSEMPFQVELMENQIELFGKVDNVMEYQSELDIKPMIYFMENKFYKTLPSNTKYLSWDFQISVYYLVGRMMYGVRFGGILYNIIRKKAPVKAEVPMYFRTPIKRSTNEVKATLKFVAVQAMQMQYVYAHGTALLVPFLDGSPMYNNICTNCQYNYDVCKAFREGEEWEEILNTNYEPKDLSYAMSSEDDLSV